MPEQDESHDAPANDVEGLRSEIARLCALVGPDETSYMALKTELWAARDLLIGMESELGNVRGRVLVLQREIDVRHSEHVPKPDGPAVVEGLAKTLRKKASSLRELRP